MNIIQRREFLKMATATAAGAILIPTQILATEIFSVKGLQEIGNLQTLSSKNIKGSHLSIGLETLDRDMYDPERLYVPLENLGIKWARLQTGWNRCETVRGQYDFGWLDQVVDKLLAKGIQPWFNLGYGNKLYIPEAVTPAATGFVPIYTAEALVGWNAFVEAITKHFAGRIGCWEIWNEPDTTGFWRPKGPNAEEYAELVKITAPLIRGNIPDATIVGLALSGCNINYLKEVMDAGLGKYVDAISFHPYHRTAGEGNTPEFDGYDRFLKAVRDLSEEQNVKLQIWQGECGEHSATLVRGTDFRYLISEKQQAYWLLRRIITDLSNNLERTNIMHAVDLFNYNWGDGPTDYNQYMGILRGSDYSPKPSYYAYQTLCTLFNQDALYDPGLKISYGNNTDEKFRSAGFNCKGKPIYAFWLATSILDNLPFEPDKVTLQMSVLAGVSINKPVLVDPISQKVYRLQGKTDNGVFTIKDIPLLNYPLIITDRSLIGLK